MRSRYLLSMLSILIATLLPACIFAQATPGEVPQPTVVLVKPAPLVYPPLARQARIMGNVTLLLTIRIDGSVEKVELVSGHPMLFPTAMASASKSAFECVDCQAPVEYPMTYTFAVTDKCPDYGPRCEAQETREPNITQRNGEVTLIVDPLCTCDPTETITRVRFRSAKCLYLWRCGSRVIEDQ
jgi:hypothetical protein